MAHGTVELTSAERERLWVDGWNDLFDAVARLADGYLVNDDWNELTAAECQAIIQTTAYVFGKRAQFRDTFYKGKPSIQIYFV